MHHVRQYGKSPFKVAVIHGGPGAPGTMAPVARELAHDWGVLEPLQTATTLEGQVEELRSGLEKHGDPPITLIGSSWGAMLGFIFAARHPEVAHKLILVGSGGYEAQYGLPVMETRLSRLSEEEKGEVHALLAALDDSSTGNKDEILSRLGSLFTAKTDTYNPLTLDTEGLEVQYAIHKSVWDDAAKLRESGELLELGRQIRCPVVAIHGDYDPHPAEGVRKPLASVVRAFRFYLLKNCGHYPWIEREAKGAFYTLLKSCLPLP